MRAVKWCALLSAVVMAAAPSGAAEVVELREAGGLTPQAAWSTVDLSLPAGWIVPPNGMELDRGSPVAVLVKDIIEEGVRNSYEGLAYVRCESRCDRPASWRMSVLRETGDFDYVTLRLDPWGRPRIVFMADGGVHYGGCDVQCHDPGRWGWTRIDPEQAGELTDPLDRAAFRLDDQGLPHVAYTVKEPAPERPGWVQPVLRYGTCATQCLKASEWALVRLVPEESASTARLALHQGRPRIAYASAPGPVYVPSLVGTEQIRYTECTVGRDCTQPAHWTPATQLTPSFANFPSAYSPNVSELDAAGTGIDVVFNDQNGRRIHRRCEADCYRDNGVSWSPPRLVSSHVGTYETLLALTYDGNAHPRTLLFGERFIPSYGAERELRYGWCEGSCSSPLGWHEQALNVPFTEIATLRFDGMRPRLLASPYNWADGAFRVSWSWCDESCGEAAVWSERPHSPPPPTGPGHVP